MKSRFERLALAVVSYALNYHEAQLSRNNNGYSSNKIDKGFTSKKYLKDPYLLFIPPKINLHFPVNSILYSVGKYVAYGSEMTVRFETNVPQGVVKNGEQEKFFVSDFRLSNSCGEVEAGFFFEPNNPRERSPARIIFSTVLSTTSKIGLDYIGVRYSATWPVLVKELFSPKVLKVVE